MREGARLCQGDGDFLGKLRGGFRLRRVCRFQIAAQSLHQKTQPAQLLSQAVVQLPRNASALLLGRRRHGQLQRPALRNVARNFRGANDPAPSVLDGRNGHRNLKSFSVLAHPHGFVMIHAFAPRNPRQDVLFLRQPLRRKEHQHRLTNGFPGWITEQFFRAPVPTHDHAIQRFADDGVVRRFDDGRLPGEQFFRLLPGGDVGADGNILARFALLVEERHDGRAHPVIHAVLGLVSDFPLPDPPLRDRRPHIAHELLGMVTGIDDAMVLPQQFPARIFGDRAELVVDVDDFPLRIGDGHNGMLVERGLKFDHLAVTVFTRLHRMFHHLPGSFAGNGPNSRFTLGWACTLCRLFIKFSCQRLTASVPTYNIF